MENALKSALCVLLLAVLAACGEENFPQDPTVYKISGIEAFPYYPAQGALRNEHSLFDPGLALWNVIIGHDDIQGDWLIPGETTVTFVSVEIAANDEPVWGTKPQMEFQAIALETNRELSFVKFSLGGVLTSGTRTWKIPFLVHGTGCEKLQVTATLLPRENYEGSSITRTIPFKCGE
tara:strand:- start:2142 stop:2675 length:534 start_codon:yes stop_codon:yes gene_type:complete